MMSTVAAGLVAKLVLVMSWAVAFAFLVKAHAEAGDGFSAGLVAGTGLVIHYLVLGRVETERMFVVRNAMTIAGAGLLLVLVPLVAPAMLGMPLLTHYPARGHPPLALGTLALHTRLLIDVGVFALVFGFAVSVIRLMAPSSEREDEP